MISTSRKYPYGSTIRLKRPTQPIKSNIAVTQATLNALELISKSEVDEFTMAVNGQQREAPKQGQGNEPEPIGPPGKAPSIAKLTITTRHQRRAVRSQELLRVGSDPTERQ